MIKVRYGAGVATPRYGERKPCGHKGFAAFAVIVNITTNNISFRDRPTVSRRFRVYLAQTPRFTDFSALLRSRRNDVCQPSARNRCKTTAKWNIRIIINLATREKNALKRFAFTQIASRSVTLWINYRWLIPRRIATLSKYAVAFVPKFKKNVTSIIDNLERWKRTKDILGHLKRVKLYDQR